MTHDEIFAIIADEHNVHYLNEGQLDAWWESLSPLQKGAIYENDLDGGMREQSRAELAPKDLEAVRRIGQNFEALMSKPLRPISEVRRA